MLPFVDVLPFYMPTIVGIDCAYFVYIDMVIS